MKKPNFVIDNLGRNHYLEDEPLGQGGQGAVFRTKDPNLAVKLVIRDEEVLEDANYAKRYQAALKQVMVLKFPDGVNLCQPVSYIEAPYSGYVMQLLRADHLCSLSKVLFAMDDLGPDGKKIGFHEAMRRYPLDKRIQILVELARTLSLLHSRGFVYCDLSPNNVLIDSRPEEFSKTWLIDCDNVRPSYRVLSRIYTEPYGAPEVISGASNNSVYSDIFSFAVIAFMMLTGVKPIFVDQQTDDEDDWDATVNSNHEESMERRYYYLLDEGDANIRKQLQSRLDSTATKELQALFERTFIQGLMNPNERPLMNEWFAVLSRAYGVVVPCPVCGCKHLHKAACCVCGEETKDIVLSDAASITKAEGLSSSDCKKLAQAMAEDAEMKEILEKLSSNQPIEKYLYNKSFHFGPRSFLIFPGRHVYNYEIDDDAIEKDPHEVFSCKKSDNGFLMIDFSYGYRFNGKNASQASRFVLDDERGLLVEHVPTAEPTRHVIALKYRRG